ncbi:hypothetical protein MUK42_20249 [Musa troglodytarum]|uniref:Protein preY, mitochondrial n=1 Tax=Musa troglodytarum TaxID=320322 RepID=A0A9E7FYG4_9LILI|nr:hypothetical protein MUK42_20249 [Musa troglodytarum]
MVRGSRVLLLKDGGGGGGNALFKVLSDILVCPLSKQPLRHCPDSRSLVSDAVGVSFPPWNNPAICNVDPPLSSIGLAQVYACLWTQHLMDFDSLESNALRTIDFRYQARPTTENPVRHIPNRIAAFRI